MTRFDAATADERRELFADAIRAHDERSSAFLTIETDAGKVSTDEDDEADPIAPWIQFADGVCNLDCRDGELDRLKSLLDGYAEFRIDELSSPENVEGTNVRVSARTDPERVAGFIESVFLDVYHNSEDYRVWVIVV
jgi:hypothetical protein